MYWHCEELKDGVNIIPALQLITVCVLFWTNVSNFDLHGTRKNAVDWHWFNNWYKIIIMWKWIELFDQFENKGALIIKYILL